MLPNRTALHALKARLAHFSPAAKSPSLDENDLPHFSAELLRLTEVTEVNYTDLYENYNENSLLESSTPPAAQYYDYGPKRDSLNIVIPVTIIYGLIFITGVIGNISTCIVIKKHRSMHTATNYYLFSLAISDFMLLIAGVPQEMYFIWSKYPYVFGEYFCIGRGLIAETAGNATVLTITAFTVERYVAICHPFCGQAMSKLSRAIRIIILIWILSVLTAIPQAAQFGIITYAGVEKCFVVREIVQHSFQLSTLIFFFAPMTIILVLYLLIGLHLYRSNIIGGAQSKSSPNNNTVAGGSGRGGGEGTTGGNIGLRCVSSVAHLSLKSIQSDTVLYRYSGGTQFTTVRGRMNQYGTRRVLKMLVAVVICFFLCWAPFHAQRLFAIYGSNVVGSSSTNSSRNNNHTDVGDVNFHAQDNVIKATTAMEDSSSDFASNHHVVIYTVMTYVSGVLYYLSTCINPLLYNIMSNKFRQAFKAILFRHSTKGSINSRRTQESRCLRRNATLTSTTQRESSESELQSKHSLLHTVVNERKVTSQLLP